MDHRPDLPIDAHLPEICAQLLESRRLVLQAEPGAGKTTRVPPALIAKLSGEIWVAEPRRVAAVLAARRVAAEIGESIGKTVGYTVRFESVGTPETRLRYLTDGLLLRRLAADPLLIGVSVVILDEFHERRLAADLALGMLRRLQKGQRPDLHLLVMSATLQVEPLAQWLDQAPVSRVAGRVFPVQIDHVATVDSRPLADQVAAAVRQLGDVQGDLLVFLPGAGEIRKTAQRLSPLAAELGRVIRPLHGSLPVAEQERALARESMPKIVLSTNLAETSVTLPDVVAVIDTGVARVAGFAAWSGLPTLQLQKISKASATQRAGRAGRTRPGRCLRLYTQFDHDQRPAFDKPEVLRSDLSETVLLLAQSGLTPQDQKRDAAQIWLDPPEAAAVDAASELLRTYKALDDAGVVTAHGRRLLALPLAPRLGQLLCVAHALGVADAGALAAALLSERDIRPYARAPARASHGDSDLFALRDAYLALQHCAFDPATARDLGLDLQAARQVQRVHSQLLQASRHVLGHCPPEPADVESALGQAIVVAFCDRLAQRRAPESLELLTESGGIVRLSPQGEVTHARLMAILDAEERRDGKTAVVQVRMAHGFDPLLILEAFADDVQTVSDLQWYAPGKRVVQRERLMFRQITLDESTRPAKPSAATGALLRKQLTVTELGELVDPQAVEQLIQRAHLARQNGLNLPPLGPEELERVWPQVYQEAISYNDLTQMDVTLRMRDLLGAGGHQLDQWVPLSVTLPGGRRVRVQYPPGEAPWIASRLQDFLGMRDGPRLMQGRVPLVLHLLAPNQRPVQLTTDLAGFWQRHYPALRKELGRRYPRHAWPEDPLQALPPQSGERRDR